MSKSPERTGSGETSHDPIYDRLFTPKEFLDNLSKAITNTRRLEGDSSTVLIMERWESKVMDLIDTDAEMNDEVKVQFYFNEANQTTCIKILFANKTDLVAGL